MKHPYSLTLYNGDPAPTKLNRITPDLDDLPTTVMLNSQEAELPLSSIASILTVVTPMLKASPGEWLASSVTGPPVLSVALGGVQLTTAVGLFKSVG